MQSDVPAVLSPFVDLIQSLNEGDLNDQLADDLTEIVAELTQQAKDGGGRPKGKLVLTLDFKVDSGMVEVVGSVKTVMPKPVRGKSIFWATTDNRLSQQNPKQLELPMRDVSTAIAGSIRATS